MLILPFSSRDRHAISVYYQFPLSFFDYSLRYKIQRSKFSYIMSRLLLLPPSTDPNASHENEIYHGLSGFPSIRCVEPAGKAFEDWLISSRDVALDEENTVEEVDENSERDEQKEPEYVRVRQRDKKGLLGKIEFNKEKKYYKLLGLEDLEWQASDAEIRKAYRKMSLRHHPDKLVNNGEKERAKGEEHFKKIVEANDVLSDPHMRRAYDSWLPFDDSVPTITTVKQMVQKGRNDEFYSLLSMTFDSNSKWSEIQPVPLFGNDSTSHDRIDEFYDFWFNFKSWREFAHHLEEDVSEGQDRYERRFIKRVNATETAKMRKEETRRILHIVELAYKFDPRLKRRREVLRQQKEEERKAIEREKLEEAERRRRKEEEEERKEKEKREEEERKEAKARTLQKSEQAKIKKEMRKNRQRIRGKCEDIISSEDINMVCLSLSREELIQCVGELEGKVNSRQQEEQRVQLEQAKQRKSKPDENGSDSSIPWSLEEVSGLAKALQKIPGGTQDRWPKVIAYMKTDRSQKEIVKKAAELRSRSNLSDAIPKSMTDGTGAFEQFKAQQGVCKDVGDSPDERHTAPEPWSSLEQTSLEHALVKFPAKSFPKDRWEKVAGEVEGRSADECKARYKELVRRIRAQKQKK